MTLAKYIFFIHVSVYEYDMEVSLSIEGLMLLVVEREFDLGGKWKEESGMILAVVMMIKAQKKMRRMRYENLISGESGRSRDDSAS